MIKFIIIALASNVLLDRFLKTTTAGVDEYYIAGSIWGMVIVILMYAMKTKRKEEK